MSGFANGFRAEYSYEHASNGRASHRSVRAGVRAGADAAGAGTGPGTQAPATPPKRPRPRAPSTATAVLTVTVNDPTGAPLPEVKVTAHRPGRTRRARPPPMGQARLLGIRAGTYRLRFEKEGFHTFEKEVSWRAGTPAPTAEATLTAAPPAAAAARRRRRRNRPSRSVPDYPAGKPSNCRRARLHRAEPHLAQGTAEGEPDWLQRRRADLAVAGARSVAEPAATRRPS